MGKQITGHLSDGLNKRKGFSFCLQPVGHEAEVFFSRHALADNYFLLIGAVKEAKVLEILPPLTRCHTGHSHPVVEQYHLDGNPHPGVLLSTFS